MKSNLLACAALAALCTPAAAAHETIVQGTYSILVFKGAGFAGCLVNGQGDADATPLRYHYGDVYCSSQPNGTDRHLWDIHAVRNPGGAPEWVHVIRNRANGKCLIRGHNGLAGTPTLHLWHENVDKKYCGLASAQLLVSNGQATWDLNSFEPGSVLPTSLAMFGGVLKAPKYADGYVTWSSLGNPTPFFSRAPGEWSVAFLSQPR